ncbi:MAG TPA: tetraacyldisaccharide 4'-kinase [Acidobacteriaceae bacterium]|nr:tetraacyldisaccharide 4'-kinase [Acidobacteriaceae bacterium]
MSRALAPLRPLYAAAAGAKNFAWNHGWLAQKHLQGPVISVGNLSVGGSGKTPLTIRLAQLLCERGIGVDVLSRGYGRRSGAVEKVDPDGSAEEFGDEPLLIAQSAEVPVFVGASRYQAGVLAESSSAGPALHLLDDGFQHRGLARDVDIVALHCDDFRDKLLPAGRLREGFPSLSRAQFVAMRQEDRDLEPELRRRGFAGPVWWMERRLALPAANRVIAFCAIARVGEFFSGLRSCGITVAAMRAWRDHHAYTDRDIAELIELRRQHEAEAFFTTEKDMTRLNPYLRRMLESTAPLHAARLVVRLDDESGAIDRLLALLPALGHPQARQAVANAVRK